MVIVRIPGRQPRPFPYMPWPFFTTDGTKYIQPPSPNTSSVSGLDPFPTEDPRPTGTCTVCLDSHNRNHCPFVLHEGNLAWGQAELTRLESSLAALKAGKESNPPKTCNEIDPKDGSIIERWPFIDWTAHTRDVPTGTIKEQEDHLQAHIAQLDSLSASRMSMHERLCNNRCSRYNHSDGECTQVSFLEFEKVHIRDLERIEAKRRKLQANKERRAKALAWKPTTGRMKNDEIQFRNGWTLADRKKEELGFSDNPKVRSPCAGRDKKRKKAAGRSAARKKGDTGRGK